ncbi:30S ribosomal protein S20 [Mycoplasma wenyonii str. Massachusetts]|uniref:Small ribosomal subunit protein bS20 n=1 Tax=Mycoplasma wenyonii (strain Massachusetts) TaxID=1197325 RepID=I6YKY4_MYCWM|nr:30S ribosomal protein S20 [Mycoplasma wenyonii]AFN64889.1 30S ribosomal protein S20 [Mycoplasma wenyonii str. Massachusetts]
MAVKKKVNSRAKSRAKELKKERVRYELRRRAKKQIKKQLSFVVETNNLTEEIIKEKQGALSLLYKTLDSKQSKGLITKGRANRLKSKSTKKLNQLISSDA